MHIRVRGRRGGRHRRYLKACISIPVFFTTTISMYTPLLQLSSPLFRLAVIRFVYAHRRITPNCDSDPFLQTDPYDTSFEESWPITIAVEVRHAVYPIDFLHHHWKPQPRLPLILRNTHVAAGWHELEVQRSNQRPASVHPLTDLTRR